MDLKNVSSAVTQIAEEKGIKPESVFVAIESAIATAYKKEYRKRSEFIRAKLNPKTGDISFYQVKFVVEPAEVRIVTEETEEEKAESRPVAEENETVLPRYNPDRHIFVEEAKEFKKDAKSGDEIEFPLEVHEDFGRIAAQAAKQVILQGLREAERASIHEEFADKEGEIVSGAVERFERGNIYVNLGRAVGIMFHNEWAPASVFSFSPFRKTRSGRE